MFTSIHHVVSVVIEIKIRKRCILLLTSDIDPAICSFIKTGLFWYGSVAQLVERHLHTVMVDGSSPSCATMMILAFGFW